MKVPTFDKDDSRGALILLTMAANADPEVIRAKLNLVINVGLGPRWKVSFIHPLPSLFSFFLLFFFFFLFFFVLLFLFPQEDQVLAKYACIAVQKIRKKGLAKGMNSLAPYLPFSTLSLYHLLPLLPLLPLLSLPSFLIIFNRRSGREFWTIS